jgi:hypothetical protein
MADEVIHFRNAALRHRDSAVRRAAPKDAVMLPVASPVHVAAVGGPAQAGVLIAEGDSWFDYPWHDVLRMLEDHHGFEVESVAHKTIASKRWRTAAVSLKILLAWLRDSSDDPSFRSAILLSGGGNDVAGDEFGMLLNHASSARSGLNDSVVRGVIDERVRDAYITILSIVTKVCVMRTGNTVPVIIHGYDHPVPDGRGFLGGWGPLPGPWLEPGFREKGYEDVEKRKTMAADLIDRFNVMLQDVSAMPEFKHVRYVDLRGTLSTTANYKTWWAN